MYYYFIEKCVLKWCQIIVEECNFFFNNVAQKNHKYWLVKSEHPVFKKSIENTLTNYNITIVGLVQYHYNLSHGIQTPNGLSFSFYIYYLFKT